MDLTELDFILFIDKCWNKDGKLKISSMPNAKLENTTNKIICQPRTKKAGDGFLADGSDDLVFMGFKISEE